MTLQLVVGIVGAVRSGSTPVGMALGSHPDVGFVGETHHALADRIDNYKKMRNELPMCVECRETCPIWIPQEMPMQPAGLHAKLADRLQRSVVVDSSKYVSSFQTYEEANPGVEFRYIVTIKPPVRQIASFCRYGMTSHESWVASYNTEYLVIAEFVRKRRFMVVDYADLIATPMGTLTRVADFVGLRQDSALSTKVYPRAHQIPGNDRAIRAQKPVDARADSDWQEYVPEIPTSLLTALKGTYDTIRRSGT